jgi:hypothetical protein
MRPATRRPVHRMLVAAAAMSAAAALAHLGCIVFGAPWYRFFGAGEQMARMAERGLWQPTVATLVIASGLLVWSLYALSGAGLVRRLPLLRTVLVAITAVYLVRGFGFLAMPAWMPGRSEAFWLWSSGICLVIGAVHLAGLWQAWPQLQRARSACTPGGSAP